MKKPFSMHDSLGELIRHFTPNWFAVNMGTGITAICLGNLPVKISFFYEMGFGLWLFNIFFFCLFLSMWLASAFFFPRIQHQALKHPVSPLFLGCLPMGLATIINGFALFGYPWLGEVALHIACHLWWLDVLLAVAVVVIVPYFMFTTQQHDLSNMTAVWLLPFVACEVAAASGGILLPSFSPQEALSVLAVSYALWGISLPLAFAILVTLFQRLLFHKLPSKEMAATIWLPLGPTGTGALSLLTIGQGAEKLLQNNLGQFDALWAHFLSVLNMVDLIGALMLLGFATWWMLIALVITWRYAKDGLSFNMSFWSFTFPLGVYTAAILNLAKQMPWPVLLIYGSVLTITLTGVWVVVVLHTLPGFYSGKLIKNPAL